MTVWEVTNFTFLVINISDLMTVWEVTNFTFLVINISDLITVWEGNHGLNKNLYVIDEEDHFFSRHCLRDRQQLQF